MDAVAGDDSSLGSAESLTARIAAVVRERAVGVSRAILFGSIARGEARPDSDVDLLLVWPDNTDEDARWDTAMGTAQAVDGVAGRVCIPLVYTDYEYARLSAPFADSVTRDGIDLLVRSP